jgi:TetR/AcrR family transcriptional repressor of nem operon
MARCSQARENLLAAARDLICSRSYGAVSVDDICAAAGVGKGSFYHFFPSKAELVAAALEAYWQACRPEMDAHFSACNPPLDRLRGYLDRLVGVQAELTARAGRVLGCPYTCIGAEAAGEEPVVRAKAEEIFSRLGRYFESALRDAVAEHALPPMDVATRAKAIVAHIVGVLTQARIRNDAARIAELPAEVFLLIGLAEPRSSETRPTDRDSATR